MKQINRAFGRTRSQSGVVLVIGLVFLLVLTIVGVTSIQSSSIQERITGNVSSHNKVFQAAESILKEGEEFVDIASCSAINAKLAASPPDPDDVENWSNKTTVTSTKPNGSYVISRVPAILIDPKDSNPYLDPNVCGGFYYVTAEAGSNRGMVVVLQSTVIKRF